ncbi:MAG: HD domain-containing protein [Chitinophagales bacterium]|nr:HD domain-containing protein [Chitinophagales bacterium]
MEEKKECRETFFERLSPYHAPSELRKIELAYTLAKFAHRAQTRKELDENGFNIRYFEHLRRTALIVMDEAKCYDADIVISALLHDSLEDHPRDITPEMMEQFFGTDVVRTVKLLSKVPKEGYLDRLFNTDSYKPLLVKACDRLDNLRSLDHPENTIEFKIKQVKETKEKYFTLFEKLEKIAPDHLRDSSRRLLEKIKEEIAVLYYKINN